MTIEEKAKAYDEALEYAHYLINERCKEGTDGSFRRADLQKMFPELKESEDERIRKTITAVIGCYDSENSYFKEISKKKCLAWLEKQGEQKPTNKVEPKFKNGQWIVWQDKYYKVNYNGCGYELVDQNGLSTSLEYGTIDENAHLWDITKDAKDGDVLSYITDEGDLWIMIYGSLYEPYEGHVHYHALLVNDNFGDKDTCCICIDSLKPATKEQRDTLFAKIKDVGYEWDTEKLELRKIEQKPQRMVSAEAKEAMYSKPTEWSEEDEARFKSCIKILKPSDGYDTINTKWLKSLKNRVQPQPKQEWGKEDENILEDIEEAIINYWYGDGDTQDILLDWLKSLRPQKPLTNKEN